MQYLTRTIYSKRLQRGKTIRLKYDNEQHKQECIQKINEFTESIKYDNKKYKEEQDDNNNIVPMSSIPINIYNNSINKIEVKNMFDKLDLEESFNLCIFATSKSGKTYLAKQVIETLLLKKPHLIPIFFVGNISAPIYDDIRDKYIFFSKLQPKLIETLHIINSHIPKKYEFLIIIDDIIDARNTNIIKNLALSYRNNNFYSIFILQNTTLITKNARGNSACYLFGLNKQEESISVLDKFLKYIPPFIDLKNISQRIKLYQYLCQNHNFIIQYPLDEIDKIYTIKAT
jgi:hypothetical protein